MRLDQSHPDHGIFVEMEHINYEERYPTHVSHASPPTYSQSEPFERQSNVSPQPVSPGSRQTDPSSTPQSPAYGVFKPGSAPNAPSENQDPHSTEPRKILGMTRTVFLLALALVLVILAGTIGGAVGGTLAKNHAKSDPVEGCGSNSQCGANISTSSAGAGATVVVTVSGASQPHPSSSITSAASPTPTVLGNKFGQIASSTFNDASSTYVYVYYQEGLNIMYTVYPGRNGFSMAQVLNLTTEAKAGTPLSATAFDAGGGTATLNLFYLDSSNNIVQASLTNRKSSTTISLQSTEIIQSGTIVHSSSSLAGIYMDATWGWRVYFQTTSGSIQELVGFNGWKTGTLLNGTGILGTALTVAMIFAPNLNVFYIDASSASLYFLAYTNSWSAPTKLTSVSVSSWRGSASISLAAIAETEPKMLRVYYVGTDNEFYEFWCATEASWNCGSNQPDQSAAWTLSDSTGPGAVGAIGWANQVRFYYFHHGDILQADFDGTDWSTAIVPTA